MERNFAEYLLNKTKQDYNLIVGEFSSSRLKMWPEIRFLVDDYVKEGDRILDLGCGNGRLLEFLKDKNLDYIGVDNSEGLIKEAKKKFQDFQFQTADALHLPFSNNSFDKVYSIAVLHHIPSEEFRLQFLKEAKRVLNSKGILILTAWKLHTFRELYLISKYAILKVIGKSKLDWKDIFEPWGKKIQRYYHCFSEKELTNLAKKAGFKIKESSLIKNKRGNRQNIYLIAEKF